MGVSTQAMADMTAANEAYRTLKYAEAYTLYLAEASKAVPEAENIVGAMSLWGRGTPMDNQAALDWFTKSAEQGDSTAMTNLAYMYQQGLAVPVNLERAFSWYDKAAELGSPRGLVMRPILAGVMALGPAHADAKSTRTIPDSFLIGSPPVQCNPLAETALLSIEAFVKADPPRRETFITLPGTMSRFVGNTPSTAALLADLAAEYAAAGCFADAGRMLDMTDRYGRQVREMGLFKVVEALTRFGYYDQALALGYSAEDPWAQEGVLRDLIVQTAVQGKYDLAHVYINSLSTWDQRRIPWAVWYPLEKLLSIHQYRGVIEMATAGDTRSLLGVDGNLVLAKARYYLKDREGAVQALRSAEEALPLFNGNYITPFDHPLTHISEVQALLEPKMVDATMAAITHSSLEFPLQVLNSAIRASGDRSMRLHWLKEVDQLAAKIMKQRVLDAQARSIFTCLGAEDYALLGMYPRSLKLMRTRECNQSTHPDEQDSRNLAQVFRVAAAQNDIEKARKIIPARLKARSSEYSYHIPPLIYGLVRIGRQAEALEIFKQLVQMPSGRHEELIDLIAEIGLIAKPDFPIEAWIAEIDARSNSVSAFQWDMYRILFAICTRTRGYTVATQLADRVASDNSPAAHIGIAEGLRGYQLQPTYYSYKIH